MDPITSQSIYLISMAMVLMLAIFVGFEVISKVPAKLHTPLMSGSNAISGITIVGAIMASGSAENSLISIILGTSAVIFATINVVGGYVVTDRMLGMFEKKTDGGRK
jgi:NAD(P) transhydrogenase subunit alpha